MLTIVCKSLNEIYLSFEQKPNFKEFLNFNTSLTAKAKGNKFRGKIPKNRTCILFGNTLENPRLAKHINILTNCLYCIKEQGRKANNIFSQYDLADGKSFGSIQLIKKRFLKTKTNRI